MNERTMFSQDIAQSIKLPLSTYLQVVCPVYLVWSSNVNASGHPRDTKVYGIDQTRPPSTDSWPRSDALVTIVDTFSSGQGFFLFVPMTKLLFYLCP